MNLPKSAISIINKNSTLNNESSKASSLIRDVLHQESEAIKTLANRIDDSISNAIQLLLDVRGRVILTGVGKMGCIARKAAATFSSTGTPAIFLHAAEAAHGDLGIVTSDDILIALSYSGRSDEVLGLIPYMQRFDVPVIAVTGNRDSQLARLCDHLIDIHVQAEAEGHLAPTCSTTVALALCDALAIALAKQRGFTAEQFAIFHPGGNLGRKLLTKVKSLMHTENDIPFARPDLKLRDAIVVISEKRMGALMIVDDEFKLQGILTDGDIRRVFQTTDNPLDERVSELMTANPLRIEASALAAEAIKKMEQHEIAVLPVTDDQNKVIGAIHIHDLVKAGLA